MANYNIEMKKRNVTNTAWDNLYPITKGGNVVSQDGVTTFDSHLSDYVRQPAYAVTTGLANTYVVTLNPAPTAYVDGMGIVVKIHAANTGAATLNVNSLGARTIIDSKGRSLIADKLKTNCIYSLKYNSTLLTFQLQGEGGDLAKLPTMIPNGSFENDLNCYYIVGNPSVVTTDKKFGSKSMYQNNATGFGAYVTTSVHLLSGHIYYLSAWCKNLANVATNIDFSSTGAVISFGTNTAFVFGSCTYTPSTTEDRQIAIGYMGANNGAGTWIDGIMLLDLTDGYGAGNEPSKAEMDEFVQANGGWWDSDLTALTSDAVLDPAMLVVGYSGYDDGLKKDGTMPNYSYPDNSDSFIFALSAKTGGDGYICVDSPTGYYKQGVRPSGFGRLIFAEPNLIAANFLATKNIFGLQGSIPVMASSRPISTDVGYWETGGSIYAKMPNNAYLTGNDNFLKMTDPDFVAANIPNGISMFSLVGTAPQIASGEFLLVEDNTLVHPPNGNVNGYLAKSCVCSLRGIYRIAITIRTSNAIESAIAHYRIGAAGYKLLGSTTSTTFVQFTADVALKAGEKLEITLRGSFAYLQAFQIKITNPVPTIQVVPTMIV